MKKQLLKQIAFILCILTLAFAVLPVFLAPDAGEAEAMFSERHSTDGSRFQGNILACQPVEFQPPEPARPAIKKAPGQVVSFHTLYAGSVYYIAAALICSVILIGQYIRWAKIEYIMVCRSPHAPPVSC